MIHYLDIAIDGFRYKGKIILIQEDGEGALASGSGRECRGVYSSASLEALACMAVYRIVTTYSG